MGNIFWIWNQTGSEPFQKGKKTLRDSVILKNSFPNKPLERMLFDVIEPEKNWGKSQNKLQIINRKNTYINSLTLCMISNSVIWPLFERKYSNTFIAVYKKISIPTI